VDHALLMEDSKTGRKLHILFAPCGTNIIKIRGCILWLMMKCDQKFDFEILPLTTLMKVLSFQKTQLNYDAVGIWNDTDARNILSDSFFNFYGSLGCKWHQREENALALNFCATNIITRSIYLALTGLCVVYGIAAVAPTHAVDMKKKNPPQNGEKIVRTLEFQQRFGLVPVDEPTRKLLRRQFITKDFANKLKKMYPEGLQVQPTTLIWPKSADVEEDLNYSKKSNIVIKKPEEPPSDDEPEVIDWNWSAAAAATGVAGSDEQTN